MRACTVIVLGLFSSLGAHAQATRPLTKEEAANVRRDAQLAMERALLEMNMDSVAYWVESTIEITRKRDITLSTYLFSDKWRTLANFHVGRFAHVQEDMLRERDYFAHHVPYIPENHPLSTSKPYYADLRYEMGIYDLWALHAQRVLQDIGTQVADPDMREFLSLYWMAMLNDVYAYDGPPLFEVDSIQRRAEVLLGRIPDHPRAELLRIWAHILRPSTNGMGFSIQGGSHLLYGELDPLFAPRYNFSLTLDATRKRWMFMGSIRAFNAELSTDMAHGDSTWRSGATASTSLLGMQLGYMVLDGPLLRITPTVGAQTASLYYTIDDEHGRTDHYFQPTIELNVDVKLNFKAQAQARTAGHEELARWSPKRHGYYLVRGTIGWAPLGYGPVIAPQGTMLYFNIGIGGFLQFATHK